MKRIAATTYALTIAFALLGGLAAAPAAAQQAGVCQCPGVTCNPTAGNCATACASNDDCAAPVCPTGNGICVPGSAGSAVGAGGTATKPSGGGLENPLAGACEGKAGQQCVQIVIGKVIKAALGIVGSIALLMMTYGGFLWLTSMGNSDKVEKGKNTLIWATMGLVLIFGAYALTSYIVSVVNK